MYQKEFLEKYEKWRTYLITVSKPSFKYECE
jgi:hypothetical protein